MNNICTYLCSVPLLGEKKYLLSRLLTYCIEIFETDSWILSKFLPNDILSFEYWEDDLTCECRCCVWMGWYIGDSFRSDGRQDPTMLQSMPPKVVGNTKSSQRHLYFAQLS